MTSLQHAWIEDLASFEAIASPWDQLADRVADDHPFLLSDFIITWWRHYQEGRALRVFVLYHEDMLVGGLPLYGRRGGARQGFARMLSYIGDGTANYTEPLCGAVDIWPWLAQALVARCDWDVLHLPNMRGESAAMRAYQASGLNGPLRHYALHDHDNWAIDLRAGKEAYTATRSKKMRRDLRSKRRHAEQRYGAVQLRRVAGVADVTQAFDDYVQFSRDSFAQRQRASTFQDARYEQFFREWLLCLDRRQRLDAHVLMAGDTVLAVSFGYRRGPGFNWVLTAYNTEATYVRPGYLLIEELIEETLRTGQTRYNWYGYDRFYKSQWCNERTPLHQLVMTNRTAVGAGYRALHRMATTVRANPVALHTARKVKQCLRLT